MATKKKGTPYVTVEGEGPDRKVVEHASKKEAHAHGKALRAQGKTVFAHSQADAAKHGLLPRAASEPQRLSVHPTVRKLNSLGQLGKAAAQDKKTSASVKAHVEGSDMAAKKKSSLYEGVPASREEVRRDQKRRESVEKRMGRASLTKPAASAPHTAAKEPASSGEKLSKLQMHSRATGQAERARALRESDEHAERARATAKSGNYKGAAAQYKTAAEHAAFAGDHERSGSYMADANRSKHGAQKPATLHPHHAAPVPKHAEAFRTKSAYTQPGREPSQTQSHEGHRTITHHSTGFVGPDSGNTHVVEEHHSAGKVKYARVQRKPDGGIKSIIHHATLNEALDKHHEHFSAANARVNNATHARPKVAAVHGVQGAGKKPPVQHSLQHGKRGGTFYLSEGKKVYAKK